MKLFESTFREGYIYYERYWDTELKKSVKKRVDLPFEWFTPKSSGLYESILDSGIKLNKQQGSSKNARGEYGTVDPMYRNIRDNYWGEHNAGYNVDANIWYLDIETRVGQSFKIKCTKQELSRVFSVKNECTGESSQMTLLELRNVGKNEIHQYSVLVQNAQTPLRDFKYCQRNSGFPKPEHALEEITLIQIFDKSQNAMIVLGTRDWKHESDYSFDFEVKYVNCKTEIELLNTYFKLFKALNPLIVYAWNGDKFDYPYLYNRVKNLSLDVSLFSNYGDVKLKESEYQGQTQFSLISAGHYYIDMLPVYKKFTFKPRPNFALDTIAEIELKRKKIQHTEYAVFDDFYAGVYVQPEHPTCDQKKSKIYQASVRGEDVSELAHSDFVYYGIQDAHLVKSIDDKRNFTVLLMLISQKMGVQISDALGTVKPWAQFISNMGMVDNKVMPPRREHPDPEVVGGYVREPHTGKHDWIVSVDVNSMYPLLGMVGFNMSPETFISRGDMPDEVRDMVMTFLDGQNEEDRLNLPEETLSYIGDIAKKHNVSLGMNGAVFSNEKIGIIPQMILDIYKDRKKAKTVQSEYEKRGILIKEMLKRRACDES